MSNEVKVRAKDNKPVCPVCGQPGNLFAADGQLCDESQWVWESGKLIAVPNRAAGEWAITEAAKHAAIGYEDEL